MPPSGTLTLAGVTTSCGVGCGDPVQATPLRVKFTGSAAGPGVVKVPLKPTPPMVPPAGRVPLYGALVTVTF